MPLQHLPKSRAAHIERTRKPDVLLVLLDPVREKLGLRPTEFSSATGRVEPCQGKERPAGAAEFTRAPRLHTESLIRVLSEARVSEVSVLAALLQLIEIECENPITNIPPSICAPQMTIDMVRGQTRA